MNQLGTRIVFYYEDNFRKALRDFQKYHFASGSKSIHRATLCRRL